MVGIHKSRDIVPVIAVTGKTDLLIGEPLLVSELAAHTADLASNAFPGRISNFNRGR
jgi:hypothetical protein